MGFIYLDCVKDANRAIIYFSFTAIQKDYTAQCKLKEIDTSMINARAKCQLGFYYYKTNNYTEAIKWYLDSAENGCTDANYDLAHLLINIIYYP